MRTQRETASYLSFDAAPYYESAGPCQVVAHSFYAAGVAYCNEVSPGIFMPVSKLSVRAAMELGYFVWAPEPFSRTIETSSGLHIAIKFSKDVAAHRPAVVTHDQLYEAMEKDQAWGSFKRHGTKSYTFDRERQVGSNALRPKGRSNQLSIRRDRDRQSEMDASEQVWNDANQRARGY